MPCLYFYFFDSLTHSLFLTSLLFLFLPAPPLTPRSLFPLNYQTHSRKSVFTEEERKTICKIVASRLPVHPNYVSIDKEITSYFYTSADVPSVFREKGIRAEHIGRALALYRTSYGILKKKNSAAYALKAAKETEKVEPKQCYLILVQRFYIFIYLIRWMHISIFCLN